MSLPRIALFPGWDCYEWRNGHTILQHRHDREWTEIVAIISAFKLRHSDIVAKGRGNKSAIAAAIDSEFYRLGWAEKEFDTRIVVDGVESVSPTHSVDCFRGKVAVELEWNNKDPFYDRDLNNFRLLFDLRVVDVGVMVTRSSMLQKWLYRRSKLFGKEPSTYGGSTTHMDKLTPRVLGGGAGGCPLVIFAMTPDLYIDDRPIEPVTEPNI